MDRTFCRLSLVCGLVALFSTRLFGAVTITQPSSGQNISADKALNSTNVAAFTNIGNIVITEGATTDFSLGNNQTLILTAPSGWRFNAGVGSVTYTTSRDIAATPSISVTATNITLTFSVNGTTKSDAITISGIQAQALNGLIDPFADNQVRRSSSNPGTAVIAGVDNDFTQFATLTQIAGVARALGMQTQPAPTASATMPFAPQPEVSVLDQFGNLRNLDTTTIVTAARNSGTGTLQGTLTRTASFGVVSYTNLSLNATSTITLRFTATNLTSVVSDPVVVGPPQADRLVFTTQPGAAVAGSAFGIQPQLRTRDGLGNDSTAGLPASQLVTIALSSGSGTLVGTTTVDIGTNAGNGVITLTDLQINVAGTNKQLTASSAGLLQAVSGNFTVNAGAFTRLQLLVPGETAAPGTGSGKIGSPSAQSGNVPFNVTVNAVDAYWNIANTVTHTVGLTSSDPQAVLPANAALVGGTKSFSVTFKTIALSTITVTDISDGTKPSDTSPVITVNSGPPAKLTIQTQPSSAATAGVAFLQQPVIRVEDANGNLVSADNGRVITAARGTGTATLQGALTATTVNGVASFASLSYNVAETITLNFTATSLTNTTSSNIAVGSASADRLIFTTQPGGASRGGLPLATQPVVRSRDPFGNNSVIGLPANLPVTLTLTSGSGSTLGTTSLDIGTAAGNGVATFTNVQCTAAGTNKQLTASASGLTGVTSATFNIGGVVPATGGTMSADTVGGAYTLLSGPTYYEGASADAGVGTIILNAPAGFIFDTNTPAPQVIIRRLTGTNANTDNINDLASGTAAAVTSRTAAQITFTVSAPSSNGVTCSLTWTNVRVRPFAGSPLASGNITRSGTATMAAVTTNSTSFGGLTELAGAANRLAFSTQPGASTAGSPLTTQPVVRTRDQFGNDSVSGLAASKNVSLALTSGTGLLQGATNLDIGTAAGNGVATFANLEIDSAGTNKQLTATASGSTNAVSSVFTINAAAASRLTIQTQPSASATAGTAFAQQPVIRIEDAFGNLRSTDNTTVVTAAVVSGTGALLGTTIRTAVNGLVTFTNLSYNVAETITLAFASTGLASATSSTVAVSVAAANRLTLQTQPSAAATAGAPFTQQPVVRIEDQFGNLRSADSATVVSAARAAGGGTLQGTTSVTAIGGIVSFANLSHNVATNITITFSSGSLSAATSSAIAVSPAGGAQLSIQTQPSSSATAGVVFAQQPVVRVLDAFGNVLTSDNSTVVTATRNAGSGTLQGTTTAVAASGVVAFTNLSHNVATNITVTFSSGILTNATSSAVAISPAAADHFAIQTQPSSSATAGVMFTQQPVVRIEDVFGNLRSSDNATVVSATRNLGSGALQGVTNRIAAAGIVSFTNLAYTAAEMITINFSGGALPVVTSGAVAVSPAAANKLTIQTQPSTTATAGAVFGQQPVIRIEDSFGNLRGSDNATVVTAARSAGSGSLQGMTGVTAQNGVVTFANLSHIVATNITIQFTSAGLSGATSTTVAISPATASKLTIQTQPSTTAIAGVIFAQQPVLRIEDSFGNLINSDSSTVVTATRDAGSGTLQGSIARTAAGGVVTFTSLSHQTAGTISIDFAGGSLSGATSANVVVNPAAPDHLVIQIQPSPNATAGVAFAQQPVIFVQDQFNNLCANTNVAVTAARNAGSGTLQGTTTIVSAGGIAGYTNLSHNVAGTITINFASGALAPVTSDSVFVSAAAASRLTVQTQPSSTTTAGVAFTQQPVVRVEDALGNLVTNDNSTVITAARSAGGGALQGTLTATAVNGVASFANLSHNVATNITIQFSSGSLASAISATTAISPAPADHLTIQTQPSAAATAGAAFASQPVIRIEDQFGNLRVGDNATLVTASRAAGSAALQGTSNRPASGGVVTFTNLSYNVAETITLGFSSSGLAGAGSSNIVVGAAAANRLTILVQPSATAVAGAAFAQQPVIRIEDGFGNLRSSDNSTVVTATRSTGSGTLQGSTSVTAGNGIVAFANLSHNVATNITIQFTSGALSNATSSVVAVSPAGFTKLQLLTPGETPAPGTATGKTGSPTSQVAGTPFTVTVNAMDANWNFISTVADTVSITSSDGGATLPSNAALISGTRSFAVGLNTPGTVTVTASDVSDVSRSANTSPAINVAAAQFTPTTGGASISADATGGTFTNLTGPVYSETASGNVGTGTIILKAPAGFVFDTGGTAPTVLITRLTGSGGGANNINGVSSGVSVAMTSVTTTQLVFTVTSSSVSGVTCSLTWQNVRVRPSVGTPLASGILTKGGTAAITGVATNSNLGTLAEVPGAARKLAVQTQPSATATAGVAFAQQPVLQVEDQFGNLCQGNSSASVSAARGAGAGTLQGTTSRAAVAGLVTFTNLTHNFATNITIVFSSAGLTNATSSTITVNPAVATVLAFTTLPGSATAGSAFGTQPVVKTLDGFGNPSSSGLPASLNVALNLSLGVGPLQGTPSLDIGTAAGNGVANFTNLRIDAAGTNKQLTASAIGFSVVASGVFTVNPAAASKLTIQTQPSANATAGVLFAQQPAVRVEDSFGNLRASDNSTTVTASRNLGSGTLQGTTAVTVSGGVAHFANLSHTVAETMNVAFSSGSLTGIVSSNVVVSPAAANRLTIQNQPSATAIAGVVFAQQPVIRIEDQYGNLLSSDNATVLNAARASGTGTLQGTTTATANGGVASFSGLSYPVAETMKVAFSSGGLTNAVSANVVVSAGAFVKLQILVPGETAAAGTTSGKIGTSSAQFSQMPFTFTVNAVDDNWNIANNVSDVVTISSSDPTATLPADTALAAGTKLFSATLRQNGTSTITASDVTDGLKASATSANIPVNTRLLPATGGSAISADTVGGAFTTLTGPAYSENASGDVGAGTIILSAPAGFMFDTNGTAPTVLVTRIAGSGGNTNNINDVASGTAAAITSRTTSQITFTVSAASAAGVACSLTWQNVRVRPTAGSPLAVTNLTKSGTASLAGLTNAVSNLGVLREIAGAANRLVIQTQPSASAMAGVAFAQQPVVLVKDQFGNLRSAANGNTDNITIVTATRAAGSGTLQGVTTAAASDGTAAFTNLLHTVATNITINFSSGSLTSIVSTAIAIGPAAASQLAFTTQPANGTVGGPLAIQPVVRTCDQFGNKSTVGLAASQIVSLTLNSGTGPLAGTTTLDIGTSAGNGVINFANIGVNSAGTDKQLTASANSLLDAVSSVFSVGQGTQAITFGGLGNKVYGGAAFGLSATASSGLPVSFTIVSGPATISGSILTIAGAGTVTVRATQAGDSNWTAALPVDRSFTVAKAPLTITADNQLRAYGAANPPLTASYAGFVNGEDVGVLSGSPSLNTVATPTSPVGGSPYTITVAQGSLASANYSFSFVNGSLVVTKATLTVAADDKTRVYGASNPPLTLSYSGFVNGENPGVLNGSANLMMSATTNSPVPGNPYPIIVTPGTLTASNYSFVFTNGILTISKAPLTVTVQGGSRVYGAPDPAFTVTYGGFVNGEDASVLSGGPDFSTTATPTSSVAGSPYVVTASVGSLSAANYSFAFIPGLLAITPASLLSVVSSSANPSPTGTNVTLSATLSALAPSAGIPVGTVQFAADGAPIGVVALNSGVASLTTASLSHGVHTVTAAYGSDGNFYGVTNSMGASQAINTPPTAAEATFMRDTNAWIKISIPDLITNYTSDLDGDPRSIVSIGSGTNSATIFILGDGIYYLPSGTDPQRNSPDHFDYTITDGFAGCLVTNMICIRLNGSVDSPPPPTMGKVMLDSSGAKVSFNGIAGYTYRVERAQTLSAGSIWTKIGDVTVDQNGLGQITDPSPPASQAFYRAVWTQP